MKKGKKMIRVLSLGIIFFFGSQASGFGSDEILTLGQAVDLALKGNPVLKAANHQVEAAQAKVGQARSGFFPRLDMYEKFDRTNNPMMAVGDKLNQESFSARDYDLHVLNHPSPISNYHTQMVFTQPIFDRGQAFVGLKQARIEGELTEKGRERIRQELVFQVIKAFSQVVLTKEDLKLAQESEQVAQSHVKLAEDFFQTGQSVKSDLLSARVRLSEVKELVSAAQNGVALARSTLNKTMGCDQTQPFEIEGDLTYTGESLDLSAIIREALEKRPDLMGMENKVKHAQENVKMAQTRFLPSFDFMAQYDLDDPDFGGGKGESWTIGGLVHLNLFDGLNTISKVREAREVVKQVSLQKQEFQSVVELEVREAFHLLSEAEERRQVTNMAIGEAEESLRIIEDRYRVGLSRMVEVIDGEVALTRTKRNHLKALFDCRVSRARVDLARGITPSVY